MEVTLASLWLPILLSGVAVFFLSFLMWMVLPHHKPDWSKMPEEDAVIDALRGHGVGAGQYSFPYCASSEEWKNPELIAKFEKGPSGFLTVRPSGPISMGKSMAVSGAFNVIITAVVAYVATMALAPGAEGGLVFRLTSTVAWLGFAGATCWEPIWFSRSWSSTFKTILDGLVYALATGAIFMAMWP